MKILFLDIDGVVNCVTTAQRYRGFIGIDPYMAILVDRIIQSTGCKVVLSSTWRLTEDGRDEVRRQVCDFIDCTPDMQKGHNYGFTKRGYEIEAWLKNHPEVKKYAILDDNTDMLPDQPFFKTSWTVGLTQEIANEVINYLNS